MQERQETISHQRETHPDMRTQQLIDYLGNLWQYSEDISPKTLEQITRCIAELPSPYKTLGLRTIAEHIVNSMNLHFLTTLVLFLQRAEQEGITPEEQENTREDALSIWQQSMAELNKRTLIESIDDLVNLSNITIGLYRLYQANSAEEAQRVLYELPKIYHDQLVQKRLLPSRLRPSHSFDLFG